LYNSVIKNNTIFRIDDPYSFLTKELLEEEYLRNKLTDSQIAKKYGIGSKVTVWRRRKFHDISNSYHNKSNQNARKNRKFSVSKKQALEWNREGKSYKEMAKIVGCSRIVLYRRLKEFGLVIEQEQAMNKLRRHEKLTDLQIKFILGDLLGDGSITPWGMYQCNHSHKQKEYIEYKSNILSNLLSPKFCLKESCVKNKQNDKTYKKYYLRTMGNKILKDIHIVFYADKRKIFPYDYLTNSIFDAYSLAIWYMDDGGRKFNIPSLYTFDFEYSGNLNILDFIDKKFSIKGILCIDDRDIRHPNKRHYISFKNEDADRFFSIVSPHILRCFQYKLPSKFQSKI